jgi:hypothetical protein
MRDVHALLIDSPTVTVRDPDGVSGGAGWRSRSSTSPTPLPGCLRLRTILRSAAVWRGWTRWLLIVCPRRGAAIRSGLSRQADWLSGEPRRACPARSLRECVVLVKKVARDRWSCYPNHVRDLERMKRPTEHGQHEPRHQRTLPSTVAKMSF